MKLGHRGYPCYQICRLRLNQTKPLYQSYKASKLLGGSYNDLPPRTGRVKELFNFNYLCLFRCILNGTTAKELTNKLKELCVCPNMSAPAWPKLKCKYSFV